MKITIKYSRDNNATTGPCEAITRLDGNIFCGVGDTYDEAKERLIAKLKAYQSSEPAPPTEEIEV